MMTAELEALTKQYPLKYLPPDQWAVCWLCPVGGGGGDGPWLPPHWPISGGAATTATPQRPMGAWGASQRSGHRERWGEWSEPSGELVVDTAFTQSRG